MSQATFEDAVFVVTYRGLTSLDSAMIQESGHALFITGPSGYREQAIFDRVVPSLDGFSQVVAYRVKAPGGGWDRSDNGLYSIRILPESIRDSVGNVLYDDLIGTLRVNIGALWLVSTEQAPGKFVLSLSDATPGSVLVWAWGTQTGQYQIASPELLLNIENPVFFAQSTADTSGQAQVVFDVPAQFASEEIYFQAYESIPTPMTSNLVATNMLPRLVTSIGPAGNPISNAQTVVFNVEFRESVLGVSLEDFVLETNRVTGARIEGVEGRGSSYRVVVNTGVGDGTITLVLKDESRIADATGFEPSLTRFGSFQGEPIRVHKMLLDANLDYVISPLDALAVIDTLNRSGGSLPVGPESAIYTYDVNADGWVTPLDVLAVIDYLNSNSTKGGEGESAWGTQGEEVGSFEGIEFGPYMLTKETSRSSDGLQDSIDSEFSAEGHSRRNWFGDGQKDAEESRVDFALSQQYDPEDIWSDGWDFGSENLDDLLDQMFRKSDNRDQ